MSTFVPLPGFGIAGRIGAYTAERCAWWRRKISSRPPSWSEDERRSIQSLIRVLRGIQRLGGGEYFDTLVADAGGLSSGVTSGSPTPAISPTSASA